VHITRTDLGFDSNRLLTVTMAYPRSSAGSPEDRDRVAAYLRTASERIGALPSVEGVSLALCPPFAGVVNVSNVNRNGTDYVVFENRTDPSYFKTAGLRIVRGRSYTADEVAGRAPVALVSESLVRTFYAGVEPIGATLAPISSDGKSGVTIIGVVADALVSHMRGGGSGTVYRPIDPATLSSARLVVRTPQPDRMLRDVEATLVAIDAGVRPSSSLMREDVARYMKEPKILAGVSTAVAFVALVLSVLGIFGVTSFVVGQRTQEVSVRMAIGAGAGDVVRLLIRQNMWPVVGGIAVGLAAALLGARVLTAALFGISPYDPLAIIPAVAVLAGTALAAVAIPALRAARTDPASVLRQ
jgi:putative ABC transport system permease protein